MSENRFCPDYHGVTDTRWWLDTDMRAWSHPCHGSSDPGKVRSVDTWHSSDVMWLVSVRCPGLGLAYNARHSSTLSCLWLTLLSSSIVSKYWQSYRITFPGSWKSCVFLILCLWVAIEGVDLRNLNSLAGPLPLPVLSSQTNLMLLSILMILPMPIGGPVIRIKTCSEMYRNYSSNLKNGGLEV